VRKPVRADCCSFGDEKSCKACAALRSASRRALLRDREDTPHPGASMAAVSDQLPNTIDLQLLDNQGNPESGFVRLAEGHPGALLAQGPASSLLGLVAGLKHAGGGPTQALLSERSARWLVLSTTTCTARGESGGGSARALRIVLYEPNLGAISRVLCTVWHLLNQGGEGAPACPISAGVAVAQTRCALQSATAQQQRAMRLAWPGDFAVASWVLEALGQQREAAAAAGQGEPRASPTTPNLSGTTRGTGRSRSASAAPARGTASRGGAAAPQGTAPQGAAPQRRSSARVAARTPGAPAGRSVVNFLAGRSSPVAPDAPRGRSPEAADAPQGRPPGDLRDASPEQPDPARLPMPLTGELQAAALALVTPSFIGETHSTPPDHPNSDGSWLRVQAAPRVPTTARAIDAQDGAPCRAPPPPLVWNASGHGLPSFPCAARVC